MKINFLPWHHEVISLWEKIIKENNVLKATLYAYRTMRTEEYFFINPFYVTKNKKGSIDLSDFDENFFGCFASENRNERSSESVTRILESQIRIIAEKILSDIENDAEVEIVSNVFQLVFYPLTEGAYIVPHDRNFVNLKKYNEKTISEIKNIVSIFEKNITAA